MSEEVISANIVERWRKVGEEWGRAHARHVHEDARTVAIFPWLDADLSGDDLYSMVMEDRLRPSAHRAVYVRNPSDSVGDINELRRLEAELWADFDRYRRPDIAAQANAARAKREALEAIPKARSYRVRSDAPKATLPKDWKETAKRIPVLDVADALGVQRSKKGLVCPSCGEGDSCRAAGARWKCFHGGGHAGGSCLDLAGWVLTGGPPTTTTWEQIGQWFAATFRMEN